MESKELYDAAFLLMPDLKNWVIEKSKFGGDIEEIRLRCGKKISLYRDGRLISYEDAPVFTKEHVELFIERATRSSYHSVSECLKKGYITAFNGIRIGICGTAVTENGVIKSMRELSSFNIRIPHEIHGAADGIFDKIISNCSVKNTLIISPPGSGKTTLLREIIRKISDSGINCGVVDERGEIAAMHNGIPAFDIGDNTDVLDQTPKSAAVMMLLRTMNPSVIAMDEISETDDVKIVKRIYGCGVSIIATIHGKNVSDIQKRQNVKELLLCGVFENAVNVSLENGKRVIAIEHLNV